MSLRIWVSLPHNSEGLCVSLCVPGARLNDNLPVIADSSSAGNSFSVEGVRPFAVTVWQSGWAAQIGHAVIPTSKQRKSAGECREQIRKRIHVGIRWEYTGCPTPQPATPTTPPADGTELQGNLLHTATAKPRIPIGDATLRIRTTACPTTPPPHRTPAAAAPAAPFLVVGGRALPGQAQAEPEDGVASLRFSFPVSTPDDFMLLRWDPLESLDAAGAGQTTTTTTTTEPPLAAPIPSLLLRANAGLLQKGGKGGPSAAYTLCNGKWGVLPPAEARPEEPPSGTALFVEVYLEQFSIHHLGGGEGGGSSVGAATPRRAVPLNSIVAVSGRMASEAGVGAKPGETHGASSSHTLPLYSIASAYEAPPKKGGRHQKKITATTTTTTPPEIDPLFAGAAQRTSLPAPTHFPFWDEMFILPPARFDGGGAVSGGSGGGRKTPPPPLPPSSQPGRELQVLKDGIHVASLQVPSGEGEGWVACGAPRGVPSSTSAKTAGGWPDYEVYCRWNFAESPQPGGKRVGSGGSGGSGSGKTTHPARATSPRPAAGAKKEVDLGSSHAPASPQLPPAPAGNPSRTLLHVKAIRARKLRDSSGERPQAVVCGLISGTETKRYGSVLPDDSGVWVWSSPTPVAIHLESVSDPFGVTVMEDIEGVPIGTAYISLTEKQVGRASQEDLRIPVDLLDAAQKEAGDCEIVVTLPKAAKQQSGDVAKKAVEGKGAPKRQKKQGLQKQATQKAPKGLLLLSLAQFKKNGGCGGVGGSDRAGGDASSPFAPPPAADAVAKIRVGTRSPDSKECRIGGSTVFQLPRLRELVNIRMGDGGGQISFLIEPAVHDGVFKTVSREGWAPLQKDGGPYFDRLRPDYAAFGCVYIRFTLEVRDPHYYDLPSGRDFENHILFSQAVTQQTPADPNAAHAAAGRGGGSTPSAPPRTGGAAVKRNGGAAQPRRAPILFYLKVREVVMRHTGAEAAGGGSGGVQAPQGGYSIRAKLLPQGTLEHDIPLQTKVKLKASQNPREISLAVHLREGSVGSLPGIGKSGSSNPSAGGGEGGGGGGGGGATTLLGLASIPVAEAPPSELEVPIEKYGITTGHLKVRWERGDFVAAPPPPPPPAASRRAAGDTTTSITSSAAASAGPDTPRSEGGGAESAYAIAATRRGGSGAHQQQQHRPPAPRAPSPREAKEALLQRKREEVEAAKHERDRLRQGNGPPAAAASSGGAPPGGTAGGQFLEKKLQRMSGELTGLREDYTRAAKENSTLRERIRHVEAMREKDVKKGEASAAASASLAPLEAEVDRLSAELASVRREADILSSTNCTLEERLARTQETHSLELSELRDATAHHPVAGSGVEVELAKLRRQNTALREEVQRAAGVASASGPPGALQEMRGERNSLLSELATLQTMYNEATRRLQAAEEAGGASRALPPASPVERGGGGGGAAGLDLVASLRAQNAELSAELSEAERGLREAARLGSAREAELREALRVSAGLEGKLEAMKEDVRMSCRLFRRAMGKIAELSQQQGGVPRG